MSYETFETIQVAVDGALATVTVAREAALNALSSKVIAELTAACGELEVSTDVRAVIVTGAGKAFVAGADIAEMRELSPRQAQAFSEMGGALAAAIEGSEKPWIACVNGFALGGGCELAMACTLRLAADTAKLGQPEISLGILPGYAGTQRLPRLVGKGRALEIMLSGAPISAAEAERIGLVNRVVEAADLPGAVEALARYSSPSGSDSVELRARAYLHANCSFCHRPNSTGQGPADFRFSTPLAQVGVCNAAPQEGDLGIPGARLLAPGEPARSILSARMHSLGAARMPDDLHARRRVGRRLGHGPTVPRFDPSVCGI